MRAMRFAAGVHTSSGFGAGGPVRPATLHPGPDEPVHVESVINYLGTFVRKNVHLRGVVAHVLLVVALSVACLLRNPPVAVKHMSNAVRHDVLLSASYVGIRIADDVYGYLAAVTANCYGRRAGLGQGFSAVNMLSIRQFRTRSTGVAKAATLFDASLYPSENTFAATLPFIDAAGTDPRGLLWFAVAKSENLDAAPIADGVLGNVSYPPRSATPEAERFRPGDAEMRRRVYFGDDPQYDLGPFVYAETALPAALAAIAAAQRSRTWLNLATKAVFVDGMFYHHQSGYFIYGTAVLESLDSGRIVTSVRTMPFVPLSLNPLGAGDHLPRRMLPLAFGVAACDLLLLVAGAMIASNLRARVVIEYRLTKSRLAAVLQFWALYDTLLLPLLLGVVYYHLALLADASTFSLPSAASTTGAAAASMTFLVRHAADTNIAEKARGWLFIGCWMRSFGFLQHLTRLAVVTETVRAAMQDLVGVTLVFLVFVTSYAVTATVLFASNLPEFATVSKSYDYLAQLIGSGQLDGIRELEDVSPFATAFLIFYIFFVIVILLNAVIGLLAASFVYCSSSNDLVRRNDWTPAALLVSTRSMVRRLTSLSALTATRRQQRAARRGLREDRTTLQRRRSTVQFLEDDDAAAEREDSELFEGPSGSDFGLATAKTGVSADFASPTLAAAAAGGAHHSSVWMQAGDEDVQAAALAAAVDHEAREDAHVLDTDAAEGKYVRLSDALHVLYRKAGAYRDTENAAALAAATNTSERRRLTSVPPENLTVSLRQLRQLSCGIFADAGAIDEVFRRAQEQRGTANGKTRHLRLVSRQNARERDMMNDIAGQLQKLDDVRSRVLGGDDDGLESESSAASDEGDQNIFTQSGVAQAESSDDEDDGTQRPLEKLSAVVHAVADRTGAVRAAVDRNSATARAAAVRITEETSGGRAALQRFCGEEEALAVKRGWSWVYDRKPQRKK
jgi:hypothetical protein